MHATGGPAMMRAAREAVNQASAEMGRSTPLLIAVTVLTSLAAEDLAAIGMTGSIDEQALRLARLAQDSGLDGVVCSAHEAAALRAACGTELQARDTGHPTGRHGAQRPGTRHDARGRHRRGRGLSRHRPRRSRRAGSAGSARRASTRRSACR